MTADSKIGCENCVLEIGNQTMSLMISKSASKNFVDADSEIDSKKKLYHCRFKNQQQTCVAADSEIDNQKLCRYRFRN
jgi:hypothetical protein